MTGPLCANKIAFAFPSGPAAARFPTTLRVFESLDFAANERKLHAFLADFQPVAADKRKLHQHPGVEFLYMIRGKIDLVIGWETHTLGTGDAIYFDSIVRHGYRRACGPPSTGLIVTVPS